MAEYTLDVITGNMMFAGTFDNLFVTLIGTERESERTQLTSFGLDDKTGKLEKDPFHESPEKDWFCSKIVVRTPEGDDILFPCHTWLSRGESVLLRGGRATKAFEDFYPQLVDQRKKELVKQKLMYKWEMYAEGMSYNLNIKDLRAIPAEIRFSFSKASQFKYLKEMALAELKLRGLTESEHWKSFKAMKEVSWFKKSPFTKHWKDDDFFGYQFLNGINPYVIKRCTKLPSNFPVTEEMVKPFLANGSSLTAEMKLTQQPSKETLIFLPSDLESDWLLAKIFVRHADSLYAQVITHLQKTHLLAESFAMATLRNLPMIHPLYKCFPALSSQLLIPHHRYTLHINIIARAVLYGPGSILGNSSVGEEGQMELMRRGLSQSTYASLCPHEDIAVRGLESIPNFYYRDDALRLWNIINSFVRAVVAYYYPSDSEVSADSELQEWINEIFYYGFLGNGDSGWIPNAPVFLHHGPPTTKGQSSTRAILVTLPNKALAAAALSVTWQLSRKYEDFVPLGTYPEQRFDEPAVLQMIKDFQAELSSLSVAITERNSELELPYNYLNPEVIENSVAI
ncbi:polyunsaturated fatty acid lipoxygenase ALOX8-like isoform X4 [Lates japonicus]|uniref:Polyunsaturated fatty acid lipoxygenase ALOX8-like isoform X4 n=1 Tax=Lates japonicus TaxID=270547 RepID=A0AAD3M907_LATJO|nr:polyunsaturated fatty acid lipoxygenase ALOX8-like isoform X4 [Lates japonicus]